MEPRLDVITLAVADLDRSLAFYRSLGLESNGINLYRRADLAKDGEFSLAQLVRSRDEVDALLDAAAAARG